MPINRTVRPGSAVATSADGRRSPSGGTMPDIRGNGAKAWSPTVVNLLVILVLEIAAFAAIRYLFKRVT